MNTEVLTVNTQGWLDYIDRRNPETLMRWEEMV